MTTIAYRDGILVADTVANRGGLLTGGITKIFRLDDGRLFGAAGGAGYNGAFLRWAAAGCKGDPPEAKAEDNSWDTGLIFLPDGELIIYEPGGHFSQRPPYYAIGSGKEIAAGAMWAGASAEQAVMAAVEHDPYTRAPLTILHHHANAASSDSLWRQLRGFAGAAPQ